MRTKKQIVESVIAFYNTSNRATTASGVCDYLTEDGKQCAVGREFPEIEFLNGSITNSENWSLLPTWAKEFGADFWGKLQTLHDHTNNWNANGLSEYGKAFVNEHFADILE